MIILQSYIIVWHIDMLKEQWGILQLVLAGNWGKCNQNIVAWIEAFTATKLNTIFLSWWPHQVVQISWHFRDTDSISLIRGLSCKQFKHILALQYNKTGFWGGELTNLSHDTFCVNKVFICKRYCANQPGPTHTYITSYLQKFSI